MTTATLTNTVTTLHNRSAPRSYTLPVSTSASTTSAALHAFSTPPAASAPPPAASSRLRLCIDNVWLDLTHWQHQHPGGPLILSHLNNQDATEAFYSLHSSDAIARIERMKRTSLCTAVKEGEIPPVDAATASFRQLRSQLHAEGWFRRSPLWELFYALSVYLLAALGTACAWWGGWWRVAAVLCVALSMQQAGWIGHDYVHGRGRYQRWLGRSMVRSLQQQQRELRRRPHAASHLSCPSLCFPSVRPDQRLQPDLVVVQAQHASRVHVSR